MIRRVAGFCRCRYGAAFAGAKGSKYYNDIKLGVAEFDATVRKVGDSMGIIIPHRVVEQIKAHPGQRIRVVIPGKLDWTRIWGRFEPTASTDEMIRRARTERD
jgi:antitoxin component of MazEF toxin-antitoxin module